MLASDVIAYARYVTNHDTDQQSTDAQLLVPLSTIVRQYRRKLGQLIPTVYTTVSASFTISSGNTQDVAGAPLTLTDFDRVWLLQRQVTTADWEPVSVANPLDPERLPFNTSYVFLERGTTLEIFPSLSVPGQTFRLRYITEHATVSATSTPLVVPNGSEEYLGELLAAKMRERQQDDAAPHLEAAKLALVELKWDLLRRYGAQPVGMAETATR